VERSRAAFFNAPRTAAGQLAHQSTALPTGQARVGGLAVSMERNSVQSASQLARVR
jgi:hypothetical protein